MKEKLFLIDAYALIFRAFYSMGKNFLYNSKGQNVTAIMMFTSTLHKIIKEEKPDKIAVVFDHKSQNIRVQEFEYYKAHRDETPEDIKISEPYIRAIIEAMNIPILEAEGYEADDVIGTIAKQSASDKLEVYMVTPDKDFAQLVQENIYIYKPGRQNDKAEILDVPKILEKWEIKSPNQVIDILALWGDAVDNIPGIPGIGEKTSKKLIAEFGSIENLIANAHELKGKQKDNVIEFAQQGLDSKKLATIITNVPIEYSLESMNLEAYDKEKLKPIFVDLEFRNLSKEILGETLQSASQQVAKDNTMQLSLFAETEEENTVFFDIHTSQANYQLLYPNTPECDQVIQMALEKGIFCFDTETTGLDYFSVKLLGISLCYEAKSAHYITLHENTEDEKKEFLQKIKGLFSDAKLLIAQNLKFDRHILESYEIQITCPVFDTMLAHFLVNSDAKHSMDAMAKNILKYIPMSYASLTGSGKSKITLADVALDEVAKYAAEDADITYQLYEKLSQELKEAPKLQALYDTIEMPLEAVLQKMERNGVFIAKDFLADYSAQLGDELSQIQEKIYEETGLSFNIDSPKQLGEVLFEHLKLPLTQKKTKTGQYPTGEEVLLSLKKDFPIADLILNYREIAKLKSTYVDALPKLIHPHTGRIHSSYNQAIASTGRLSSTEPNLQNIPIRSPRGQEIRKAFCASDSSHVILSADYSQIELRLMAAMSGDKTMIEAFHQNIDIHRLTASKVFGIPFEEVTKEQRSHAKTVNFGIIYGVSAFGLSQQTNLSQKESKELIQNYFATYPSIKSFMDAQIDFAKNNGFVETLSGRRRYTKDINSSNFNLRGFAERIAINAPVQGSAADMIKVAMIEIQRELDLRALHSKLIMQVHDELVFEVVKSELEEVNSLILDKMQNSYLPLSVPIVAEFGVAENWFEAH